jgi:O-antigen/teichoic acid export membrane protein
MRQRLQEAVGSLVRSRSLADTFWVGSGTLAGGAFGALSSAILARSLGVEDFGVYSLIMSLVVMAAALCDLGISGSMVRFGAESLATGDDRRLHLVMGLAAQAKAVLTVVVVAGSALFLRPILSMVGARLDSRVEAFFLYSLITVVIMALSQFFPPVYQTFKRFRPQAVFSVSGPGLKALLLVALFLAAAHLSVAVALWIEGIAAATTLLLYWISSPVGSFDLRVRDPVLRSSMLSFNKWLSLYFIIGTLGGRVDVMMLGGMADAHALGLYGAAMRVVSLLLIACNAYLTVLLPDFARVLSHDALRRKRRHAYLMTGAICAGLAVIALVAPLLVRVVFGPSFAGVTPLIRMMLGGTAAIVLGYPVNGTLYVLNKSVVFAFMAAASALVLALLCWLLIPIAGAMGAAVAYAGAGVATSSVAIVYYLVRGWKVEQMHPWQESAA